MACGTPVLASTTSSIPETLGQAAQLVPCDDEGGWIDHCELLMEDIEVRSRYIQLGMMRVAMFSWQKTVKDTWKFYRAVVSGTLEREETRMMSKTTWT